MASLALLLACAPPAPVGVAPPTHTPVRVDIAGFADGRVDLWLDTDAVAEAFPLEGRVVTRSPGGVVVVRGADLAIERVVVETSPAAVIGHAGHDVLVALYDGRTARLDASGRLTFGPAVAGAPVWIGEAGGRRLAVGITSTGEASFAVDIVDLTDGSHRATAVSARYVFNGSPADPAAVYASDSALHLGYDWGEWGGAHVRIGLVEPSATLVDGGGVYGFARVGDALWLHGGTVHMGMLNSFVVTDGAPSVGVYEASSHDEPPAAGPVFPITHVLAGPGEDLTVLAFSEVWRADRSLSRWDKVGTLDLTYRSGRPDAVGSYPAVTAAWLDDAGRLFLGTRHDGLRVRELDGRISGPAVSDTLGVRVDQLLSTVDGLVAIDGDAPLAVTANGITRMADPWGGRSTGLSMSAWDVDEDGHLRLLRGGVVATWRAGITAERTLPPLGDGSAFVRHFADGDGVLAESRGVLWARDADAWVRAGAVEDSVRSAGPLRGVGGGYFLAPWPRLLLARTGAGAETQLRVVADDVTDATLWGAHGLFLARAGQLARWDATLGEPEPVSIPAPPDLTHLATDGCGRLWLAGDAIAVVVTDPSGRVDTRVLPSVAGLAGRRVRDFVGRPSGVAVTDGVVIGEVSLACDL